MRTRLACSRPTCFLSRQLNLKCEATQCCPANGQGNRCLPHFSVLADDWCTQGRAVTWSTTTPQHSLTVPCYCWRAGESGVQTPRAVQGWWACAGHMVITQIACRPSQEARISIIAAWETSTSAHVCVPFNSSGCSVYRSIALEQSSAHFSLDSCGDVLLQLSAFAHAKPWGQNWAGTSRCPACMFLNSLELVPAYINGGQGGDMP